MKWTREGTILGLILLDAQQHKEEHDDEQVQETVEEAQETHNSHPKFQKLTQCQCTTLQAEDDKDDKDTQMQHAPRTDLFIEVRVAGHVARHRNGHPVAWVIIEGFYSTALELEKK